jgi:anti-sigma regulatory factor (Ser/Thr protein kinase)
MAESSPPIALVLAAENSEYPRLKVFVDRACKQAGCSSGQRMRVQLVLEELFSNTVKYGRRDGTPVSVSVTVEFGGEEPMTVHYEDDAPQHDAFDQSEDVDELKATLSKRRVGGLGILLIRELGKNVNYAWAGGKNHVTFSVATDMLWPRQHK